MSIEVVIPGVGESITEVLLAAWIKKDGETVKLDEELCELESEKATVNLPSPAAGVLKITIPEGSTIAVGTVIGAIEEAAVGAAVAAAPAAKASAANDNGGPVAMPSAEKLAAASGVDLSTVSGTGKGGRILKEDVQNAQAAPAPVKSASPAPVPPVQPVHMGSNGHDRVVAMSPLRKTIARRLVEAQQTAAILTTFNEIDMGPVMALRKKYQDKFQEKYGIKVGFMSFFVKASVEALKAFPAVNAEIRGTDIVYKDFYDIGIAVGGGKGLVVPVVRGADRLSFSQVEQVISDFGKRAQKNAITMEELQGGTFSISNGGVYGSLMSTPILNPPQSGILGLHKIMDRAMVVDGQCVPRPMMFVALSYDHRLVDGREAVGFLVKIKELMEDPTRMLLEV